MTVSEEQDPIAIVRSWAEERELTLEHLPVPLDEACTIASVTTTGHLQLLASHGGRTTALMHLNQWVVINPDWEGKLLRHEGDLWAQEGPTYSVLVRRNLGGLSKEDCDLLRQVLRSL